MWHIEEHRRVDKQLSGLVPVEVLKRYEKWKDIARLSGPQGLRACWIATSTATWRARRRDDLNCSRGKIEATPLRDGRFPGVRVLAV